MRCASGTRCARAQMVPDFLRLRRLRLYTSQTYSEQSLPRNSSSHRRGASKQTAVHKWISRKLGFIPLFSLIPINMSYNTKKSGGSIRQMAARGALLLARAIWLAAALALCFWLLLAGTHHWRSNSSIAAAMERPLSICRHQPTNSACTSLLSNLLFLVLAPFLLAASSLAILVLQPLCGKAVQAAHFSSYSRLAATLLPPR